MRWCSNQTCFPVVCSSSGFKPRACIKTAMEAWGKRRLGLLTSKRLTDRQTWRGCRQVRSMKHGSPLPEPAEGGLCWRTVPEFSSGEGRTGESGRDNVHVLYFNNFLPVRKSRYVLPPLFYPRCCDGVTEFSSASSQHKRKPELNVVRGYSFKYMVWANCVPLPPQTP